jgi:hypothetical protein
MAGATTPSGWGQGHATPAKTIPWRLIFRVIRWSTYIGTAITLLLLFHKAPPPVVQTNPRAAARVEQKFEEVERSVASGQPATMRMDQTELNSYLASHLDIASSPAAQPQPSPTPSSATASPTAASGFSASAENPAAAIPTPTGTTLEQVEQVRSAVKDVKVELIEDRVRAYVLFDFHGKDLSLQLEGKLGAQDGYLHFEPVGGQIGSLPIPQSTLETAVRKMMESPENREKLKLPADMTGLKIENGEVIATYN